jgi:hypothetical protein
MKLILLILLATFLSSCGNENVETTYSDPWKMTFSVVSSNATTTTISFTTSFNCFDCRIFRNGMLFSTVDTESNTPYLFTVKNSYDCFNSDGLFFLIGYLKSNTLCLN